MTLLGWKEEGEEGAGAGRETAEKRSNIYSPYVFYIYIKKQKTNEDEHKVFPHNHSLIFSRIMKK